MRGIYLSEATALDPTSGLSARRSVMSPVFIDAAAQLEGAFANRAESFDHALRCVIVGPDKACCPREGKLLE